MNKQEIIKNLADEMEITQVEAKRLFDATFDELSSILADGDQVNIQGFGTFSVKKLEERKGFNPLLKKWMMLPEKLKPRFKPSDILKEKVNSK